METVQFGPAFRKYFAFDDSYINLNHGSFGACPKSVRQAQRSYQDQAEAAPDRFIRYTYPELLDKSRQEIANYLNVDVDEIVFVPNATTAVNVVLRNMVFKDGDVICHLDTIYGACRKTVEYIVESTPAIAHEINIPFPKSDDDIIDLFREGLRKYPGKVRLVIFDTIVSLPCVRLPFERMAECAREEGVMTLVDGAHSVGHLPLDLKTLKPDFFTSNCHKWLFTPRPCAILYTPKHRQPLLRSSVPTSHWFVPLPQPNGTGKEFFNPLPASTKSNFVQQFEFTGTLENSPFVSVTDALRFRRDECGGEDAIMSYCWQLAREGGQVVADILGTEVLDNKDKTLTRQCAMVTVRLPLEHQAFRKMPGKLATLTDGEKKGLGAYVTNYICEELVTEHDTFIAVVFYRGSWWARFSAQVYLELEDFRWGGNILKELCKNMEIECYKS